MSRDIVHGGFFWRRSRFPLYESGYRAWLLLFDGCGVSSIVSTAEALPPVFQLKNNQLISAAEALPPAL